MFHKIANFNNITLSMNAEDQSKEPFLMVEFEGEFCTVNIKNPTSNNNFFLNLAWEFIIDWIEERQDILLEAWKNKDYSWINTEAICQN